MRSPLLGAAIAAALISIAGTENNQLPMRRLETLELDNLMARNGFLEYRPPTREPDEDEGALWRPPPGGCG